MAMETIKLLTDLGTPLLGTVGYYDSLASRWDYIPLHADPGGHPAPPRRRTRDSRTLRHNNVI